MHRVPSVGLHAEMGPLKLKCRKRPILGELPSWSQFLQCIVSMKERTIFPAFYTWQCAWGRRESAWVRSCISQSEALFAPLCCESAWWFWQLHDFEEWSTPRGLEGNLLLGKYIIISFQLFLDYILLLTLSFKLNTLVRRSKPIVMGAKLVRSDLA